MKGENLFWWHMIGLFYWSWFVSAIVLLPLIVVDQPYYFMWIMTEGTASPKQLILGQFINGLVFSNWQWYQALDIDIMTSEFFLLLIKIIWSFYLLLLAWGNNCTLYFVKCFVLILMTHYKLKCSETAHSILHYIHSTKLKYMLTFVHLTLSVLN